MEVSIDAPAPGPSRRRDESDDDSDDEGHTKKNGGKKKPNPKEKDKKKREREKDLEDRFPKTLDLEKIKCTEDSVLRKNFTMQHFRFALKYFRCDNESMAGHDKSICPLHHGEKDLPLLKEPKNEADAKTLIVQAKKKFFGSEFREGPPSKKRRK